ILLTHTQKTTDADHQCSYLAGLIDKHIVNLADRTLCLVVDVLLVVVGDRPAIGGEDSTACQPRAPGWKARPPRQVHKRISSFILLIIEWRSNHGVTENVPSLAMIPLLRTLNGLEHG